jgi:hypothetical protein
MLWKILTLIGVAVALWRFARGLLGGPAAGAPTPRRVDATDMARCPRCGAWRDAAEPCACRTPPTP